MRWVVFAISVTIASCGSDVENQNIEGVWIMPCSQSRAEAPSSEEPSTLYYSTGEMEFSEGMVSASGIEYTDPECTLPVAEGTALVLTGSYETGERLLNGDDLSVTAIDLNLMLPGLDRTLTYKTIYRIEGGILYFGLDRLNDPSQRPDTPAQDEQLDFDYPLLRVES